MPPNDYKPDEGKPPVMDAVLIPYRRAILAIAAMKLDMAVKHKLQGATDPYLEWKQLPNAKARLANAGARHALEPWEVNTKDGRHLHMTHAIVGLLMALELHLEAEEKATASTQAGHWPTPPGFDPTKRDHVLDRELAMARLKLFPSEQDLCCGAPDANPIHGPAGADWREPTHQVVPRCPSTLADGQRCAAPSGHAGGHWLGEDL